jgi:hypothetical protein
MQLIVYYPCFIGILADFRYTCATPHSQGDWMCYCNENGHDKKNTKVDNSSMEKYVAKSTTYELLRRQTEIVSKVIFDVAEKY